MGAGLPSTPKQRTTTFSPKDDEDAEAEKGPALPEDVS